MKHKWLNILQNKKESNTVDINIRGEIVSDKWRDSDFSPEDLDEIVNIDAEFIKVFLNTVGGEIAAGIEIASILKRHKAFVTVINTGLVASIGTVIQSAGDEKGMVKNGVYMIHDPSWVVWGNSADMRKAADILDVHKEAILTSFDYNNKLTKDEISVLMTNETWMNAQDTLDNGFIDYIVDEEVEVTENKADLVINGLKVDKKRFKNLKNHKIEVKTVENKENKEKIEKEQINAEYTKFSQIIAENQITINSMEVL